MFGASAIGALISHSSGGGGTGLPFTGLSVEPFLGLSVARRLGTAYTGPIVRVGRSTDANYLDVGTVTSGSDQVLDSATLNTWLSGATPSIITVYNQGSAGSALNFTNAAGAVYQPPLVLSGINSKPCIEVGTQYDCYVASATGAPGPNSNTLQGVFVHNALTSNYGIGVAFQAANDGDNTGYDAHSFAINKGSGPPPTCQAIMRGVSATTGTPLTVGTARLLSFSDNATTVTERLNRVTQGTGTSPTGSPYGATGAWCLGATPGVTALPFDGLIGEFILENTFNSTDLTAIENNCATFWGIS